MILLFSCLIMISFMKAAHSIRFVSHDPESQGPSRGTGLTTPGMASRGRGWVLDCSHLICTDTDTLGECEALTTSRSGNGFNYNTYYKKCCVKRCAYNQAAMSPHDFGAGWRIFIDENLSTPSYVDVTKPKERLFCPGPTPKSLKHKYMCWSIVGNILGEYKPMSFASCEDTARAAGYNAFNFNSDSQVCCFVDCSANNKPAYLANSRFNDNRDDVDATAWKSYYFQ